MHSLRQGPIDSILEETILRYRVQMHPKELWKYSNHELKASKSATLSEEHFDNHKLITTTISSSTLPMDHPPQVPYFPCQLDASPKVQCWETNREPMRHWQWGRFEMLNMFSPLIVGLLTLVKFSNKTRMKTCWQPSRIEVNHQELDFENGTTVGVEHLLVFHMWCRFVGGVPSKQCRL